MKNENIFEIIHFNHLSHLVPLLDLGEHLQHVVQRREVHLQQLVHVLMIPVNQSEISNSLFLPIRDQ